MCHTSNLSGETRVQGADSGDEAGDDEGEDQGLQYPEEQVPHVRNVHHLAVGPWLWRMNGQT